MRTPWALSNLNQETAYAGIGYSIKYSKYGKTEVVLGCSHIYNAKGEGLKYKLSKIKNDRSIPAPLKIVKHYGKGNINTIATEILGFTKMNWNSFDLYTKLPATIDTSNTLARIGNLLSRYEGKTYDYRYFI